MWIIHISVSVQKVQLISEFLKNEARQSAVIRSYRFTFFNYFFVAAQIRDG
jgi:hypothetical protein